ncbi:hypothetical protein AVEN_26614-1 [Araneus ventricosus]|uniref:Uncharacterized protein n=1 Tax=Araneus ventricosus TaxID=182803 RepID=A0A4Y2GXY9_ARAVE|nr:hypothetical protein AVEN_26614-1 [Araneus ventricosus]
MDSPCRQHNRSLQSPRATVPTPSPEVKTGPSLRFPKRTTLISLITLNPLLAHFLAFAFVRGARSPLSTRAFSFMAQRAEWKMEPDENPNILTTSCQFSSELGTDDRFCCKARTKVLERSALDCPA